jgi:K+-sensing histidine kinase KdpD
MPDLMSSVLGPPWLTSDTSKVRAFGFALLTVLLATLLVWLLLWLFGIERIVGVYLVPVLVSSIRWGLGPGLFAAFSSITVISLLFAKVPKPLFLALDWEQLVRLGVFCLVAIVASRLASYVKQHAETAERATSEARRRAETEQLRDALIGSVSHELRTPLSSILGATTVLVSAPAIAGDPKLGAMALVVREETARLNNSIQNLLDATRISSDGLRPRFQWGEVADIVNAAVERHRPQFPRRTIEINLAPELPLVYADQNLIEQALSQVIGNALKYSAAPSPVRVSARAEDGALVLEVSDQGVGIPPTDLPHVAERFFRGEHVSSTTPGSGLGLWIAKAFLHANGGNLTATSGGADRGTTVILRLPIPAQKDVSEDS